MKHTADAPFPFLARTALGLLTLVTLAGCTEDIITGVDEDRPGTTVETIEVVLAADELPHWRDTTYTGFRIPADVPFSLVADSTILQARTLARFEELPDSLTSEGEEAPVTSFTSAGVRLSIDTARTVAPEAGFTVRLFSLARPYDAETATWSEAREGETWNAAGADLERELGSLAVEDSIPERLADGLLVPIDAPDSVLTSWRESGGEPGLAVLVEGPATHLRVQSVELEAEAELEGLDEPGEVTESGAGVTFIYEPEAPPPGTKLRMGGLPASRTYVEFRPPDSVETGGVRLRDVQINRAELVFRPVDTISAAFRADSVLNGRVIALLASPLEYGPRTPVGPQVGEFTVDVRELGSDRPLRVTITDPLQAWAAADTVETLRFGFQLGAEGGFLHFLEFGSVESAGAEPLLRLLVTPRTSFDL